MEKTESSPAPRHYDEKYFEWQRKIGSFTAEANRVKFEAFASPELNILDFGCGGGFMLKGLPARERRAVEINPAARKQARENGVQAVETIAEIPDAWADLVISDHALEHVPDPLGTLRELRAKVKPGRKLVFVIPCENLDLAFDPNDHNQHLFSWCPQSLGNLFQKAGYRVLSCEPFFHKHFPYSHRVRPIVGAKLFNGLAYLYGRMNWRKSNEVRLVAVP